MHILTRIHISYHRCVLYMNLFFASSHMVVPMQVLTLRTFLYIYINISICSNKGLISFYRINGSLVYEPVLCKLTYMCLCKCSNQDPLARTCHDHGLRQFFPSSNLRVFFLHMCVYFIYKYNYLCIYWFFCVYVFVLMCVCVWNVRIDVKFSSLVEHCRSPSHGLWSRGCMECHCSAANEGGYDILWYWSTYLVVVFFIIAWG